MGNIFNISNPDNIHEYWPMPNYTPRISQTKVLEWIEALPTHIKYIFAEIPVGGGKSPLAINLSAYLDRSKGSAYIITPQKILQKQYEESFDKRLIHSMYGKSNYTCEMKQTNCENGSEIKPKCISCPHKDAFMKCKTSNNIIFNYALAINMFAYANDGDIIRKRKLMVFDEAHMMESVLTEHMAMVFSEHRCKEIGLMYLPQPDLRSAINWIINKYVPALKTAVGRLTARCNDIVEQIEHHGRNATKDDLAVFIQQRDLSRHLAAITDNILLAKFEDINEKYVYVVENSVSFKLKLLYGSEPFHRIFEPMAEKFLFMSSTILNKEAFCDDLGIDPDKTAFISVDSEFELDNRPVLYMPSASMSYGWDSADRAIDRKNMLNKIIMLCNEIHPTENGVIHTGSFQIAKWLVDSLQGKIKHKIMHHNPGAKISRDSVIEAFQQASDQPKLLISPSVTEGLDLKGDKGRFAIFAKVPYPYLGDAWVKKRMNLSQEWYTRQALIQIIQGGGRVVRSHDDWGHVYILDSTFHKLYAMAKKFIPKWWADSVQKV